MGEGRLELTAPLADSDIASLTAGQRVLLSGAIYAARDAAHKRLVEAVMAGMELPVEADGTPIYYVGPTPERPGYPIGSAGPTTSGRMDAYSPVLMRLGFRTMIGKGARCAEVKKAIVETRSVYLAAVGGAGALVAQSVISSDVIAYPDLGPEAIRRIVVRNLPLVVVNDMYGGDWYEQGRSRYRRETCQDAV